MNTSKSFAKIIDTLKQIADNTTSYKDADEVLGYYKDRFESFENVMCNLQQDDQNLIEAGQRAGAFVAGLSGATDKILKGISL